MNDLQANVVFQRLRNARRDREAAEAHDTGPHADFHAARAAFWQAAAGRAARGDLTPVTYAFAYNAAGTPVTLEDAAK